jgi:hypothetical protein
MGDKSVEERTTLTELEAAINTLKALALVTLEAEEPLAIPEPPEPEEVAEYEQHMAAITAQVAPNHQPLLAASLRDYKAGFPDRAGLHLSDLVNRFLQEPEYATAFSPAARKRLEGIIIGLREL